MINSIQSTKYLQQQQQQKNYHNHITHHIPSSQYETQEARRRSSMKVKWSNQHHTTEFGGLSSRNVHTVSRAVGDWYTNVQQLNTTVERQPSRKPVYIYKRHTYILQKGRNADALFRGPRRRAPFTKLGPNVNPELNSNYKYPCEFLLNYLVTRIYLTQLNL